MKTTSLLVAASALVLATTANAQGTAGVPASINGMFRIAPSAAFLTLNQSPLCSLLTLCSV